ncbi:hypothetical protein Sjap_004786 [Stephania japonica]|uniref:Flavin-containing monooxygenase n=1 Tax=Stephania japonica TaxID=461633 RepID=A0AAP0K2V3_9MAGN
MTAWLPGVSGVAMVSLLVLEEVGFVQLKTRFNIHERFLMGKSFTPCMDYLAMEDATAAEFINGKRIIVVGHQKSAMEIAVEFEEGSIVLRKSQKFSFCKDGVMIDSENESSKTDAVMLATGYRGDKKLKNIFKSPTFQQYIQGSSSTIVPLHRGCIHLQIPQLAVIGYSESLSNLFTLEIRCRRLTHLLEGNVKLPSIKETECDGLQWERYMKRYTAQYYKRTCMVAVRIWYIDQLLKDMGLNPKRKKNFLAKLFQPYGPSDYAILSG